jgi:hypothetical protein
VPRTVRQFLEPPVQRRLAGRIMKERLRRLETDNRFVRTLARNRVEPLRRSARCLEYPLSTVSPRAEDLVLRVALDIEGILVCLRSPSGSWR